jgi:hypothetical protein
MMCSVASFRVSSGLPLGYRNRVIELTGPLHQRRRCFAEDFGSALSSTPVLLGNGINGRRPYSNKIAIKNLATGSLDLQSLDCSCKGDVCCATHNWSLPKASLELDLPVCE